MRERSLLSRFARSAPTQATAIDDTTRRLPLRARRPPGDASTNLLDDDALRDAAARAGARRAAAARSRPGRPPGPRRAGDALARPRRLRRRHRRASTRAPPAAALRDAFAVAARPRPRGVRHLDRRRGRRRRSPRRPACALHDRVTDAFMKVICRDRDGRSGYAIDAAHASRRDRRRARSRGAPPRRSRPSRSPSSARASTRSCSTPRPSALLLDFLGGLAFNGLAHAEGRGALAGRLGTRVAARRRSTSTDAPRSAGTLPRAFDLEGVPKAPIPLIEDGVARNVVHDRARPRSPAAARARPATRRSPAARRGARADEPRARRRRRARASPSSPRRSSAAST